VLLRKPSYWLDVLADLDYHGTKLSDVSVLRERMLSYTAGEVHKTVRKFIRPEGYLQVIATPKERASPKTQAAEPNTEVRNHR
jgi:hypothetical protein